MPFHIRLSKEEFKKDQKFKSLIESVSSANTNLRSLESKGISITDAQRLLIRQAREITLSEAIKMTCIDNVRIAEVYDDDSLRGRISFDHKTPFKIDFKAFEKLVNQITKIDSLGYLWVRFMCGSNNQTIGKRNCNGFGITLTGVSSQKDGKPLNVNEIVVDNLKDVSFLGFKHRNLEITHQNVPNYNPTVEKGGIIHEIAIVSEWLKSGLNSDFYAHVVASKEGDHTTIIFSPDQNLRKDLVQKCADENPTPSPQSGSYYDNGQTCC